MSKPKVIEGELSRIFRGNKKEYWIEKKGRISTVIYGKRLPESWVKKKVRLTLEVLPEKAVHK